MACNVLRNSSLTCVCLIELSAVRISNPGSLARLLHDISRVYSLLLLTTDHTPARNLLITTAEQLHRYMSRLLSSSLLSRVRMVREKNGSDPVPDFMSAILADPGPDPVLYGTHLPCAVTCKCRLVHTF